MFNDIKISILCVTRRADSICGSIQSLSDKSSYKNFIEYLIWIDSDDLETYKVLKKLQKEIANLRLFVCPRVGFNNMGFMIEHLIKASKGDIFLPWADDCTMTIKKWDKRMIRYIDEEVIIGKSTRIGFTRKLVEKHDIIGIYKNHPQMANEYIKDYGEKNNLYRQVKEDANSKRWFKIKVVKKVERVEISLKDIADGFNIFEYEVKE